MFYNEFDVLELRLEVLDKYVDKFVLVEAELNHIGTEKPLYFKDHKERYAKWADKIVHIVVTADESPKDENPWSREKHQRQCILKGLTDVPDDAVIMVSDVDEIPNMDIVFKYKLHPITSIHMWMFEYSFKYMYTGEPWFGTVITNSKTFKEVGPNFLRDNRWKFPFIQYAGWHLSSFGTPEHVCNKMHTFAHAKDGHHESQTPYLFKYMIDNGIHTDTKTKLEIRPENVPLPSNDIELLKRINLIH